MTEKNEALRLADSISRIDTLTEHQRGELLQAAAELRRLHAQRDALLSLLGSIRGWDALDATADGTYWKREIDAAIKAVGGEPK